MSLFSFLNREQIYSTKQRPKTVSVKSKPENSENIETDTSTTITKIRGSSARCIVCSGRYVKKNQVYVTL